MTGFPPRPNTSVFLTSDSTWVSFKGESKLDLFGFLWNLKLLEDSGSSRDTLSSSRNCIGSYEVLGVHGEPLYRSFYKYSSDSEIKELLKKTMLGQNNSKLRHFTDRTFYKKRCSQSGHFIDRTFYKKRCSQTGQSNNKTFQRSNGHFIDMKIHRQ